MVIRYAMVIMVIIIRGNYYDGDNNIANGSNEQGIDNHYDRDNDNDGNDYCSHY